jgi:hypothetical protein
MDNDIPAMQSPGITHDRLPNITPKAVNSHYAYKRQNHTQNKNDRLAFTMQNLPYDKPNIHICAQLST